VLLLDRDGSGPLGFAPGRFILARLGFEVVATRSGLRCFCVALGERARCVRGAGAGIRRCLQIVSDGHGCIVINKVGKAARY